MNAQRSDLISSRHALEARGPRAEWRAAWRAAWREARCDWYQDERLQRPAHALALLDDARELRAVRGEAEDVEHAIACWRGNLARTLTTKPAWVPRLALLTLRAAEARVRGEG